MCAYRLRTRTRTKTDRTRDGTLIAVCGRRWRARARSRMAHLLPRIVLGFPGAYAQKWKQYYHKRINLIKRTHAHAPCVFPSNNYLIIQSFSFFHVSAIIHESRSTDTTGVYVFFFFCSFLLLLFHRTRGVRVRRTRLRCARARGEPVKRGPVPENNDIL